MPSIFSHNVQSVKKSGRFERFQARRSEAAPATHKQIPHSLHSCLTTIRANIDTAINESPQEIMNDNQPELQLYSDDDTEIETEMELVSDVLQDQLDRYDEGIMRVVPVQTERHEVGVQASFERSEAETQTDAENPTTCTEQITHPKVMTKPHNFIQVYQLGLFFYICICFSLPCST